MDEQYRQRVIREKLTRAEAASPAAIPSGFPLLDRALGIGGFPRGHIVEVFGPSACGKTSFALRMAASLQRAGMTPAWIDADGTFDPGFAAALGVSIDGLVLACPRTAEEGLEIARRLAQSQAVDLITIDSAAALTPRLELEARVGDSGPGLQARVLGSGLRRLAAAISRSSAVALLLNQSRGRPEPGGEAETSAGGPSLKLYSTVRIALAPGGDGRVRFRVLKNKAGGAFDEGDIAIAPA